MLQLCHLSKAYVAGKPVLTDINLEIAARGITSIIGPSGTGKSTLIRCINRLVEPTEGEILFDGQDLVRLTSAELRHARRHIGMVFQEFNLVERLTVMENLLSGRLGYVSSWRAWRRKFPADDIRKAFELLDVVGLAGFAHRRADALSGGQRQRVGIARAVMQEPKLLLADEPTSSLDPRTSVEIMALLVRRRPGARDSRAGQHARRRARKALRRPCRWHDRWPHRVRWTPVYLTDGMLNQIYGGEDWLQLKTARR